MKKISRNEFIAISATSPFAALLTRISSFAGTGSTAMLGAAGLAKRRYIDDIGFQVFTLRSLLTNNARTLFQGLSKVGIKNIEFFDPATLNEYVPIVKDCGMMPLCTHFMPGYISGKWEYARKMGMPPPDNYQYENIIEDCNKNGVKYMGIAIILPEERETLDDYKRFAEMANKRAEQSKSAGIQLYYHSHAFEFEPTGGTTPYEEMLKIFDPELVRLEMDVFWLTVANLDPVSWMQRVGKRLLFLHLEDLRKGAETGQFTFNVPPADFVELGTGMVDFRRILPEARKLGIRYIFIDQDHTQMSDKIESVRKNCEYIRSLGI
jgi:sugar phosphate isomerase/epimerase